MEVHLANGLPSFTIVGLPETEVKESKDRVRAALQNCQFEFPARRITVNLAPADLPKESGRFDLPIALGILAATGQIIGLAPDDWRQILIWSHAIIGEVEPEHMHPGETLAQATEPASAAVATIDLNRRYVEPWLGDMRGRFPKEVRLDVKVERDAVSVDAW